MIESVRLEKGDTVIFNNHRAMHGREPYKVPPVLVTSQDPASHRNIMSCIYLLYA